jgi:hypothetical protein
MRAISSSSSAGSGRYSPPSIEGWTLKSTTGFAESLGMTHSQRDQIGDDRKADGTKREFSGNLLARKKARTDPAAKRRLDKARVETLTASG